MIEDKLLSTFDNILGKPGEPGSILFGRAPENHVKNSPLLVFVPGLTNNSSMFYKENTWYEKAVNEGYQTAFVELYDTGGNPRSYWDNGAMLAWQLGQIHKRFPDRNIAVIGFSKGAVDAQTALIHYGRSELVQNLYAIGSPHHGSQLADLAFSAKASWLAAVTGMKNEGTRSVQTGFMAYFRSITDSRKEIESTSYQTIAGNHSGPLFSRYFLGGLIIPGDSDGVVSVESASLPYGEMIKVGSWNHGELALGRHLFPLISDHINGKVHVHQTDAAPAFSTDGNRIVRGGIGNREEMEYFIVEDEIPDFTADWLSTEQSEEIILMDPDGKHFTPHTVTEADEEFFRGAWHHTFRVKEPEAGKWGIGCRNSTSGAYLLVISINSPGNPALHLQQSDKHRLKIKCMDPLQTVSSSTMRCTYTPCVDGIKAGDKREVLSPATSEAGPTAVLPAYGEGIYNLAVDVSGHTSGGTGCERTIMKSVYCDNSGKLYGL
ncbi:esterase/lipase family protein [Alteribacter natronophilus]|uniref:esterase/lipase family protein n=1 Tax=Alteribacter natronophilus TaxID=2583810 RepID=UPI00110E54DA|nr:alpha/beta fold hydrolase [Alteribacter natronophilus]TMW73416.1 hypothetical protein FGB90_03690 [Alteribacter natronophilus]